MFSAHASGSHISMIVSNPLGPNIRRSKVAPAGSTAASPMSGPGGFTRLVELWIPLSWALNMVNRSMGKEDLYPFVLPPAVLEKMRLIHTIIEEITSDPAKIAQVSGPAS